MDVERKFEEKRTICRNRKYDDNVDNETLKTGEEIFRTNYFLYIVDQAFSSLQSRFDQFRVYEGIFSFLFSIENLKSLDDNKLKDSCLNLESSLNHNNCSDIDGIYLFSELRVLREIIHLKCCTD